MFYQDLFVWARLSSLQLWLLVSILAIKFSYGAIRTIPWKGRQEPNKIFDYTATMVYFYLSFMLSMTLVGIIGASRLEILDAITVVEWNI